MQLQTCLVPYHSVPYVRRSNREVLRTISSANAAQWYPGFVKHGDIAWE